MNNQLQTVNVALAVASVVGPILFGYIIHRGAQFFSTREAHLENKARIAELERKVQAMEIHIALLRGQREPK